MELKNLLTFHTIARRGNYTRAAEELGYAQSTLPIHIQAIEKERLLFPKMRRKGRGICWRLTNM